MKLTPIPFMKRQMRFSISPSRPGTYFVMMPGRSTVRGRKAPKRHARRRSSGNQKPRFFLYLITILSDIQPESGAPTRERKKDKSRLRRLNLKAQQDCETHVHYRCPVEGSINQLILRSQYRSVFPRKLDFNKS